MFTLFLTFRRAPPAAPRFANALAYRPSMARDPYLDDGAPPELVVQAYFDSLVALEAAAAEQSLPQCEAQGFSVHAFPVPDPKVRKDPCCTYLVAYEGPADDAEAWHAEYLAHHPRLMATLPGIRALEVYRPVEWRAPPGWQRERFLQRNKVVFDDAEALSAALASPVRAEMRAHFAKLPPYRGRVTHYPMTTTPLATRITGKES